MMKKIYLACPFNHDSLSVRVRRFLTVTEKAAQLMNEEYNVFSPITHSYFIESVMDERKGHEFWMKQDLSYIRDWCDELWIYKLPGWHKSQGIKDEFEAAIESNKFIKYLEWKGEGYVLPDDE